MTPETDRIVIGAGRVYIDLLDDAGQTRGERYMGDAVSASVSVATERTTVLSGSDATARVLAEATRSVSRTLSLTLHDMSAENLALFLAGSVDEQPAAADTVRGEVLTDVRQNRWYQLGVGSATPAGVGAVADPLIDAAPAGALTLTLPHVAGARLLPFDTTASADGSTGVWHLQGGPDAIDATPAGRGAGLELYPGQLEMPTDIPRLPSSIATGNRPILRLFRIQTEDSETGLLIVDVIGGELRAGVRNIAIAARYDGLVAYAPLGLGDDRFMVGRAHHWTPPEALAAPWRAMMARGPGKGPTEIALYRRSAVHAGFQAGDDYRLDAAHGRLYIAPGGAVADGTDLAVDYTAAAPARARVLATGAPAPTRAAIRYIEDAPGGEGRHLYAPLCVIAGSGDLTLMSGRDAEQQLQLTAEVRDPAGGGPALVGIDA